MSEKPITQRIKDRLAAYTAMLRDIDNQLERLDRMEMTMASPPGPDLTGMPRGSGTPSDRTGMMVERKMELEEQIDRLKAEEKQGAQRHRGPDPAALRPRRARRHPAALLRPGRLGEHLRRPVR